MSPRGAVGGSEVREMLLERPWIARYPSQVPSTVGPIPDENAYEMLRSAAERFPHRPAIAWFGRHLSYRELDHACGAFAAVLQGLGVGAGDRVGLILPNCPQYVIAYYATLRLGAVVVGNNPLYSERELVHQLTDADVSVVIVLDSLYRRSAGAISGAHVPSVIVTGIADYMGLAKRNLAPIKLRREAKRDGTPWPTVPADANVRWWRDEIRRAGSAPPIATVRSGEDPAALVYTGGTTGLSKGAIVTHRNVVANTMQSDAWFLDTRDGHESILCVLPFFHCYGMTVGMNLGILKAATLVLVPRFDVEHVMREIHDERPSLFPGVPKIYALIADAAADGRHDLSSIKSCLCGAGALPTAVAERFQSLTGGHLAEGYGLTEASPVVSGNPLDGSGKPGTIGIPLPDTDAKVVDLLDPSRTLGPGQEGELWVRGPQVMQGYWHRPDDTASVLQGEWLRTGDVVVMDEDGFFRVVDRLKDMVKVSGYNVFPTEIEDVLYGHPKVAKVCVVGVPDPLGDAALKAFVVLRPGETATEEELRAWCANPKTGLVSYRVPRSFEFRDSLPETLIGKVLRRQLLEEEKAAVAAGV